VHFSSSKKLTTFFSRRPQNTGYTYQINHSHRPNLHNFLHKLQSCSAGVHVQPSPVNLPPSPQKNLHPGGARAPSAPHGYAYDKIVFCVSAERWRPCTTSTQYNERGSLRSIQCSSKLGSNHALIGLQRAISHGTKPLQYRTASLSHC